MITAAQVKKLFPSAKADLVTAIVANWEQAAAAGITTRQRKALFFAMIGVETGGLSSIVESLNYRTAKRIRETWPSRFPTDASTQPYVKQAEKLANFVYANRLGNGPAASGDGWKYRGGGMLQTTGLANYLKRGTALGLPLAAQPDLLRQPKTAFLAAVAEWTVRKCNVFADRGDVKGCRRAINGGEIGLADAEAYYKAALKIFASDPTGTAHGFADLPADEPELEEGKMSDEPSEDLVKIVQGLLRDKGYPEVGNVDGDPSNRTATTILAFQHDNGLPLTGEVSSELVAQIAAAPHREVSFARATATAADLKSAPSISLMDKLEKFAFGALGIGASGTAWNVQDALQKAISIKDAVVQIGPWIVLVVGGAVVVVLAGKFIREQVIAYRAGRHV